MKEEAEKKEEARPEGERADRRVEAAGGYTGRGGENMGIKINQRQRGAARRGVAWRGVAWRRFASVCVDSRRFASICVDLRRVAVGLRAREGLKRTAEPSCTVVWRALCSLQKKQSNERRRCRC